MGKKTLCEAYSRMEYGALGRSAEKYRKTPV